MRDIGNLRTASTLAAITALCLLALPAASPAGALGFGADPDAEPGRPVELDLPSEPVAGAVTLIVDDGTADNFIGDTGQFVWFNRFTPDPADFPFQLEQVEAVFGFNMVPLGGAIDIVVYEDTDGDGDPGTGAVHLATFNDTVQANDGSTLNTYNLAPPVVLSGPGDVLIGIINRYGSEGFNDFPAALDQTATQGRSWAASYLAGDAPDPPTFPADEQWGTIDSFGFPGNWLVRGSGTTIAQPPPSALAIPALSGIGLALLGVLLAASAWLFLRRRRAA